MKSEDAMYFTDLTETWDDERRYNLMCGRIKWLCTGNYGYPPIPVSEQETAAEALWTPWSQAVSRSTRPWNPSAVEIRRAVERHKQEQIGAFKINKPLLKRTLKRTMTARFGKGSAMEPSPLERAVIEATLGGEHPVLAVLRKQWAKAQVTSRDHTGVGLYLTIDVAPDAPTVPIKRLLWGDVIVDLPDKKEAMGSLVFIEDGQLTCLEMYTFDMPWPDDVSGFVVKYVKEPRTFAELEAVAR